MRQVYGAQANGGGNGYGQGYAQGYGRAKANGAGGGYGYYGPTTSGYGYVQPGGPIGAYGYGKWVPLGAGSAVAQGRRWRSPRRPAARGGVPVGVGGACHFADTTVVKAIHAICVAADGHQFPASHMVGDTWINSGYEGEVARCLPGSVLKVMVGSVMMSSEGMAVSLNDAQVLSCGPGQAVRHFKDGMLKCAVAEKVPDCTERNNLRKWGTGDMFFTYVTRVCLDQKREVAGGSSQVSSSYSYQMTAQQRDLAAAGGAGQGPRAAPVQHDPEWRGRRPGLLLRQAARPSRKSGALGALDGQEGRPVWSRGALSSGPIRRVAHGRAGRCLLCARFPPPRLRG